MERGFIFGIVTLSMFFWGVSQVGAATYNMTNGTPITLNTGDIWKSQAAGQYANNVDMTQVLSASGTNNLVLYFTTFTLLVGDTLFVYDGNSTSDPLLAKMSNNMISKPHILSSGNQLCFRFKTNTSGTAAGWSATAKSVNLNMQTASTAIGSPCSPLTQISGFCTDENPNGVTYNNSNTSTSPTLFTAAPFLGTSGYGCLGSSPYPAWYFMKISNPGNLLIYIQQTSGDVDFICWGPFIAWDQYTFKDALCAQAFTFGNSGETHRPPGGNHNGNMGGYPTENVIDCSYAVDATEWCYIPNGQTNEIYLLLMTNFHQTPGQITFSPVQASSTASTDCSITALAVNTGPYCAGDEIHLICQNPSPNAVYQWTGPNGWSSSTQNPVIPNATPNMSGSYSFVKIVAGVASPVVYTEVEVFAPDTLIIYDSICMPLMYSQNGFLNIATNSPGIHTYTRHESTVHGCDSLIILNLFVSPPDTVVLRDSVCLHDVYTQHDFNVVANTPGEYVYTKQLTTIHGCDSIVFLYLTVEDSLIITPLVDENTCKPNASTITLTPIGGISPYYCLWNSGETSMQLTNTSFGLHSATITDVLGCTAQFSVTLIASDLAATASPIAAHCNQPDGSVTIIPTGGTGIYTVDWQNINQQPSELTATNLRSGTYSVSVSDGICTREVSFTINNIRGPEASFVTNYDPHNLATPVIFSNTSVRGNAYHWDLGDGSTSTDFEFSYTYGDFGKYTVTLLVTDLYHCVDSFTNVISLTDYTSCHFPNAFTPDGFNPYFKPICHNVLPQDYKFEIFNRWGNLVYRSLDYYNDQGWNGKYSNGKSVTSPEVFVWKVSYRNESNVKKIETGYVTVIPGKN